MRPTRKVAIVMSRLRKLISPHEVWLAGLRAVLREIAAKGDTLLVVEGTAGTDLVRHGAARLGVPCEILQTPSVDPSENRGLPATDQSLIDMADIIYVLQLRTNGNVHQLLERRVLRDPDSVLLVDLPDLQAESTRNSLCASGASLWSPSEDQARSLDQLDHRRDQPTLKRHRDEVYLITSLPSADDWQFLTHTTRACPGPWPRQSFAGYADSLLTSSHEADHSGLGTLRRIVAQRTLLASDCMIRGGYPVVSFTACPLPRLPDLHRYRPHRVRWDFEPYGICLRRDWLSSRGTLAVKYGDDRLWDSLSEAERPYFQLAVGDSGIDWSAEQECRHIGDLDLSNLTNDDVLLFVPTFEAAKSLAEVTDWPITLCPTESV